MNYQKYKYTSQQEVCYEFLLWAAEKYPRYHNSEIITLVVNSMKIPRSSVRRCKSELLDILQFYVDILEEKKE